MLGDDIYKAAVNFGDELRWPNSVADFTLISTVLSSLCGVALLIGGTSCLVVFSDGDASVNWRYQSRRFQTYLYLAATVLVVGLIYSRSVGMYPIFAIETPEAKASAQNIISGFIAWQGVEYSLILGSFAIPLAWIQFRRSERIAEEIVRKSHKTDADHSQALDPVEVEKAMEAEKLNRSPMDALKTIVAILSPALVGNIATLTSFG